jgi:hypothetical protein
MHYLPLSHRRTVDGACWYKSTDRAEILRWLIGTQTFWIIFASVGEVNAFVIILGYLIVHTVRSSSQARR